MIVTTYIIPYTEYLLSEIKSSKMVSYIWYSLKKTALADGNFLSYTT